MNLTECVKSATFVSKLITKYTYVMKILDKSTCVKLLLGCASIGCVLLSAACSSGSGSSEPDTPNPPVVAKVPIRLNVGMKSNTRVTDTAFEQGDKVGLFVVNYSGSTAGTLQASGNHADNVAFTYDSQWKPATTIYWKDEKTPADFYLYYPYGSISSVEAHPFSVKADQSTLANYKASEFLYGKSTKVAPTSEAVTIQAAHLMSCAVIKLAAGSGFTDEGLAAAEVSVKLNGCKLEASINLKDGSLTATGEAATITPLKEENQYRALVVPQQVKADNFITVTVDGRDYNLKKDFTFVSKTRHTFTVTLSKTSNGINVNVSDWADDETDQGGTAE